MRHKVRATPEIDIETARRRLVDAQISFILYPNIETIQHVLSECCELNYFLSDSKKPYKKNILASIDKIKSYYSTILQDIENKEINRVSSDISILLKEAGQYDRLALLGYLTACMCDTEIGSKHYLVAKKGMEYSIDAIKNFLEPKHIEVIQSQYAPEGVLESIIENSPLRIMLDLDKA